MHGAFVDGLGLNPKADPETIGLASLILRQKWKGDGSEIIKNGKNIFFKLAI